MRLVIDFTQAPWSSNAMRCLIVGLSLWVIGLSSLSLASDGVSADQAHTLPPPKFATSTVKPWGFKDKNGNEDGLLVDFGRELSLESKIAYQNFLQPYPRVIHSLNSGIVDFAVLFDSHASRDAAIRVGNVTRVEIIVVAVAGAEPRDDINDLEGMNIGYIRGSRYGPEFDSATHFTRIPINTMHQGLAMLLNGRIDAMASADQSLYWAMDKMGVEASKLSKVISIGETTGGLYMSKKSGRTDLLPIYQQALKRMAEKGSLARIFYHQPTWAFTPKPLEVVN